MPACSISGALFGDEGKGRDVDVISEEADEIVRYQGGDNAGHTFYVLSFPGNDRTFVYDFQTKFWHERRSISDSTNEPTNVAWRAGSYMNLQGKHIVGDTLTGKLYR